MKNIVRITLVAFSFLLGSFTMNAQQVNTMEEVYQQAQKKGKIIANEIGLNTDEEAVLVRHITAREQILAKVEINKANPSNTTDFSEHVAQANEQFKKSIAQLFPSDKSKKILSLYTIED